MMENTQTNNNTITQSTQSVARPPIVVIMGHVDHGKSSLLEAIREDFRITAKESGGITQHIGAYQVEYAPAHKREDAESRENGPRLSASGPRESARNITFLDTPGHEAFSAMRSRGAKVADIAVLVVAADEGVKQQTKEAIEQAQKAEIPMIVAINKIDKPEANPERVKTDLAQNNVLLESYGGKIPFVLTSASTKQGIPELLEMILLLADMEELQADPSKPARGVIIESAMDSKRGASATLLVLDGTLRAGDIVASGTCAGKIRILEDFQGNAISEALPSAPARAIGFVECPVVGDEFQAFASEEEATAFQSEYQASRVSGAPPAAPREDSGAKTFPIILKADVAGSLEAIRQVLAALPQESVALTIVESGIGEVNEHDVKLAQGVKARIIAFRTSAKGNTKNFAERENISIETFDVIYDLIQRVRVLLEKPLEQKLVRKEIGELQVLAVFFTEKDRQIVGGRVAEGEIRKASKIEVFRNGEKIGNGRIVNLQKNKKDAGIVSKGEECGILYEGNVKTLEGDSLHFFVEELIQE